MTTTDARAAVCDGHHWRTHVRGGHPIHIRICALCNAIDWDDLTQQADALRGAAFRDVLDGTAIIVRDEVERQIRQRRQQPAEADRLREIAADLMTTRARGVDALDIAERADGDLTAADIDTIGDLIATADIDITWSTR